MNNIIPFFEINGQRYEIKRTRYLLAEYNKLAKESQLKKEDKANAIKAQTMIADMRRYAEKVKELEDKFFETLDEEDERRYMKAKELYDKRFDEFTELELDTESLEKMQKAGVDLLEKIAIKGLAEQHFNFDESKAKALWEMFVENNGNDETVEWLSAMNTCLFEKDEEEDKGDFLSIMRKKAQEKANNRKKIKK